MAKEEEEEERTLEFELALFSSVATRVACGGEAEARATLTSIVCQNSVLAMGTKACERGGVEVEAEERKGKTTYILAKEYPARRA